MIFFLSYPKVHLIVPWKGPEIIVLIFLKSKSSGPYKV
jgi:hypothetical protein